MLHDDSFFNIYILIVYWLCERGMEGETETDRQTDTLICCSIYWYIHWLLLLACALTGDRTHNLGVSGRRSSLAVPTLFGTRDRFCGRQFFHWPGRGGRVQDTLMPTSCYMARFPAGLYWPEAQRLGTPALTNWANRPGHGMIRVWLPN